MKNIVFVPLKDYFISRKWVFIKFLFPMLREYPKVCVNLQTDVR